MDEFKLDHELTTFKAEVTDEKTESEVKLPCIRFSLGYSPDGSELRFSFKDDDEVLKFYRWFQQAMDVIFSTQV